MRFWDSSAVVALLIAEPRSRVARSLLAENPALVLWWGTPLECASALWRRRRNADIARAAFDDAFEALASFRSEADLVGPSETVLEEAIRILSVHSIGSADALQLSAALARCGTRTSGAEFVCFDRRLREAARREGFSVLPPFPPGPFEPPPLEAGAVAAEARGGYGEVRTQSRTKIRKR